MAFLEVLSGRFHVGADNAALRRANRHGPFDVRPSFRNVSGAPGRRPSERASRHRVNGEMECLKSFALRTLAGFGETVLQATRRFGSPARCGRIAFGLRARYQGI